uniref:Reverse transcriptase domain-containing protein n=1 Tax=Tanacetum cinerariifolium TaxID=118510 RepID=A0A699K513_TANCI|nr:hypothetical protein [Tanacetum cinerariifolium]
MWNTVGREKSQLHKTEAGPRPTGLQAYCDKNYNQLLPIIVENFNKEKERNKKLKEVKARLNFEGCFRTSRYSESRMMNTKEHEKRHISRRFHSARPSPSVFSRIRRDQSRSPNQNSKEKARVCSKGWEVEEGAGIGNQDQRERNQVGRRMTCLNHGSKDPEDQLKIFQATAKTERWAIGNGYNKKGQNPSKTGQNRAQKGKRGKVNSQKSTKRQTRQNQSQRNQQVKGK